MCILYVTGAAIQKKWRSIRTCYSRELLKKKTEKSGSGASGRKQYVYFETLRFLETVSKTTISSLDDGSGVDGNVDTQDVDGVVSKQQEDNNPANNTKTSRKRQNKENDDLISVLKKKICMQSTGSDEEDEDRLFLLSLVSEMHKVPHERKLKLKCDIIMAISNAQHVQQMPQPFQYNDISSLGIPVQSVPQFNPGPSSSSFSLPSHSLCNRAPQSDYVLNISSPASIPSNIGSPTESVTSQYSDAVRF